MAGSKVSVTFVGDSAQLIKQIDKQQASIDKLTNKYKQLKAEGRASTKSVNDGLATGVRTAVGFAAALTGVGSAAAGVMAIARQIKAEYEALKARQERAAMAHVTLSEAKALSALQRPESMSQAQLAGMVGRISGASGMTQTDVWKSLPGPLSAMGSASPGQFESAMTLGSRIRARAGEGFDLGTFVGGTLDVMRATGLQDARSGLGFVRQFGQAARMEDVQGQVRALAPALTAGAEVGASPEEVAELVAYISQRSADPEGRLSSTAAINLMIGATKQIIPTQQNLGGRMRTVYTQPGGGTFAERLGSMQQFYGGASEAERLDMLSKIGGRAKTRGAIMGLLSQAPGAMAELTAAQGKIGTPGGTAQAGLTDALLSEIETSPVQTVRLVGARTREALQIDNSQGAMAGALRDEISQTLRDAPGVSDLQRKIIMAQWEVSSKFGTRDPIASAVSAIDKGRPAAASEYRAQMGLDTFYYPARRFIPGSLRERTPGGSLEAEVPGVPGPVTVQGLERNPSFDPQVGAVFNDLVDAIRGLKANSMPVTITGDDRPKQIGGSSPNGE